MQLNKNYRIVFDTDNTILQFFEQREKMVKDEVSKKFIGTGEFKEFTENFYYPNLKTALNGFLNKSTWDLETAKEVLEQLLKIENIINNIK